MSQTTTITVPVEEVRPGDRILNDDGIVCGTAGGTFVNEWANDRVCISVTSPGGQDGEWMFAPGAPVTVIRGES